MKEYDLVVLGGGPGGYSAAIRASKLGADVAIIEKDELGGTCTNRGCIPTKALSATAHLLARIKSAEDMGIDMGTGYTLNFSKAVERKDKIVSSLRGGIEKLLQANRVELVSGRGILSGKGRVVVEGKDNREVQGKSVILATGSVPATLPVLPLSGERVVTSDGLLSMRELPRRLLVVGGGVIGCEFASIYKVFGVEVTVVELLDRLLPTLDPAISSAINKSFRKVGIQVLCGVAAEGATISDEGVAVRLQGGKTLSADTVLVSTGRRSATQGTGILEQGISLGKGGSVLVDEQMRTSMEGVYAVGDLVGKTWLAHTAMAEGEVAAGCVLDRPRAMRYGAVPAVVFTDPEVACVGLMPAEARERGMEVQKGRFYYAALGKALCDHAAEGHLEILADRESGKVLGGWVVGEQAGTLISEIALAVDRGMTAAELGESIRAHPTLPEMITEAALDTRGMALHKAPARKK